MEETNGSQTDFNYNVAYTAPIDFLSAVLDNDGADNFFGLNPDQQMSFNVAQQHIKQEIMSPMPSSPALDQSSGSLSEYSTPCSYSQMMAVDTNPVEKEAIPPIGCLDEEPDDTLVSNSPHDDNIDKLNHVLKDLCLSGMKKLQTPARKSVKFDGLDLHMPSKKGHSMETRQDTHIKTPVLELRTRSVTRQLTAPIEEDAAPNLQETPEPVLNNIRDVAFEVVQKPLPVTNVMAKRKFHPSPTEIPLRVKFSSMVENMHKFHFKTPDRFHSQPSCNDVGKGNRVRQTMHNLKTTIPMSPALQSKLRARPVHVASREQMEEAQLKEFETQRKQMKAHPLNPKIFKTPQLGKRVERRVTTVHPFKLTVREAKPVAPEQKFCFTARPVPKAMLNGPTGLKEKPETKVTEPITPSFVRRQNSAKKMHRADCVVDKDNETFLVKKDVFHFGVFSTTKQRACTKIRGTKVVPFSFEQRYQAIREKKQEQMQKVLEAEKKAREFHAKPLPRSLAGSRTSVEENQAILPNHLVLSQLLDDGYAARRAERLRKKLEEEEAELAKSTMFKARPATVIHAKPFEPKLPEHPLQEIRPFEFNTERRAKEWDNYNQIIKVKEEEREKQKKIIEMEKDLSVKEMVLKSRRTAVHKARPVPKFQPHEIKPSDKILTAPQSPFGHRVSTKNVK